MVTKKTNNQEQQIENRDKNVQRWYLQISGQFTNRIEVKKLEKLGGEYLWAYIRLLLFAITDPDCCLEYNGAEESLAEEWNLVVDVNIDVLKTVIDTLIKFKLLWETEDGRYYIQPADEFSSNSTRKAKPPNASALSTPRVQKHRAKIKENNKLLKERQMLETTDKLNETQDETLHETDETFHVTDETGNNSNSKNYSNNRSYIHNQNNKSVYVDEYGRKYELEPTDDVPLPDESYCPPEQYDDSYCYDEYENNDNNTTETFTNETVEQENDNTQPDEIDLLFDENGELKDRKSMYIITADGRHVLNHAVFERMAQIRKQREQKQEPDTQQEDNYWKPNPNRPSKDRVRNYMIQTAKDLGKDINMVDIEHELKRYYETNDRRSTWNTADWQFWVKRWVENERFGSNYIQSGGDMRLLNSKFVS